MNWTWHYHTIQGRLQNVQGSQIILGFRNFTLQLMTFLITTIRMIILISQRLVMVRFCQDGHDQKLCKHPFVAFFFHPKSSYMFSKYYVVSNMFLIISRILQLQFAVYITKDVYTSPIFITGTTMIISCYQISCLRKTRDQVWKISSLLCATSI